jgi:uncharacterized protein (DUF1778 family)
MAVPSKSSSRREALNLRIQPKLRGLIDQAAELAGENRTDFILDAARRAAEETILDRTVFVLSPKDYREFAALLDAPPAPNTRLRKSMRTLPPWK